MNYVDTIQLLSRCQNGDSLAIEALVRTYTSLVYQLALSALDDPAEADEATQDALVAALRKLDSFRGQAKFTIWLYTITLPLLSCLVIILLNLLGCQTPTLLPTPFPTATPSEPAMVAPSALPAKCPPACAGTDLKGLDLRGVDLSEATLNKTTISPGWQDIVAAY